jgi:hypothetical protein
MAKYTQNQLQIGLKIISVRMMEAQGRRIRDIEMVYKEKPIAMDSRRDKILEIHERYLKELEDLKSELFAMRDGEK